MYTNTIILYSFTLILPRLLPAFPKVGSIYKTCGEALHKRLIRVCKRDTNYHNSRSLARPEQTHVNYSFSDTNGRNESHEFQSVSDDCCSLKGCSDSWIRQSYCILKAKSKRDSSDDNAWNGLPLKSQDEYDCYQTDTFYYNWWSENEGGAIVNKTTASDPSACQKLCAQKTGCKFFSFSQFGSFALPESQCVLRARSGGGAMRWVMSVAGPANCLGQGSKIRHLNAAKAAALLNNQAPIDSCIELANANTKFQRTPGVYDQTFLIPFNPRFSDPNQFNLLQIKLKDVKTFTLYIAPKVSEDFQDKVSEVKKMFKNAYTIEMRKDVPELEIPNFYEIAVNHMTNGEWSVEKDIVAIEAKSSILLDEILIRFLPTKILTYFNGFAADRTTFFNGSGVSVLSKPAWFDSVENIWFFGDSETRVSNFFHCTSGMTVPWDFNRTKSFQLDFKPKMAVGSPPLIVNYVVFYGFIYADPAGQFQIDFLSSVAPNNDSAFVFSVRNWHKDAHIVYNARVNNVYGDEIRYNDFPFGSDYTSGKKMTRIDFMFLEDRINIAVNGIKYHSFDYRNYKREDITAVRTHRTNKDEYNYADPDSKIPFYVFGVDVKWISYHIVE